MICTDCNKKPAVTKDGTNLCLKCLRARIASENPIVPVFNDERGRKARSSELLGGVPDFDTDEYWDKS